MFMGGCGIRRKIGEALSSPLKIQCLLTTSRHCTKCDLKFAEKHYFYKASLECDQYIDF